MTVKDRHLLDFYWIKLSELAGMQDNPATAGEFARRLGISVNTARKYLERMCDEGAVGRVTSHHGNVTVRRYYPKHVTVLASDALNNLEMSK